MVKIQDLGLLETIWMYTIPISVVFSIQWKIPLHQQHWLTLSIQSMDVYGLASSQQTD